MIPRLRGRLHAYAFWAALIAAPILIGRAPAGGARVACVIYGVALCALFAVSALYHRWRWDPRWRPLLRRIDHSTIFVFIAASATPVAVLIVGDEMRTAVLAIVWSGAVAGVLASVAWIDAPRGLVAASYVAVGCAVLAGLPQIVEQLPLAALLLFASGGALYLAGAVIYARRRPDPWPQSFGFHEVFHALVVAAAVMHFAAMVGFVLPAAAG